MSDETTPGAPGNSHADNLRALYDAALAAAVAAEQVVATCDAELAKSPMGEMRSIFVERRATNVAEAAKQRAIAASLKTVVGQ